MRTRLIGSRTRDYSTVGIQRLREKTGGGAEAVEVIGGRGEITLVTGRCLALEEFSLPMVNRVKIRSALTVRAEVTRGVLPLEVFYRALL